MPLALKAVPAIEGLPTHANAALAHVLAKTANARFANCMEFVTALLNGDPLLSGKALAAGRTSASGSNEAVNY